MDTSLATAVEHLAKGALLRQRDARGHGVAVFSGRLWVTQDGDPRDHVVDAGESLRFDRDGLVIMQALADARLLRLDPIADPAPIRRPDAIGLHREARRQRSEAIGNLLLRLVALLRRPWTRA